MRFLHRFHLFLFCLITPHAALAFDSAPYLAASKKFDQLVEQSLNNHSMPRLTDAETSQVISVLSDSDRFLNSTTFHLADLDTLRTVCEKAQSASMPYMFFDLASLQKDIASEKDPQVVARKISSLIEGNILTFQNELEKLQPFIFHCLAKEIPLIAQFVTTLPAEQFTDVRRAGIRQMRNGISQIYLGALQVANSTVYSYSYREKLLHTLAETATVYSSALSPDVRKQISDVAYFAKTIAILTPASAPSGDSAILVKYLGQISEAMAGTTCEMLCAI